MSNGTLVKSGRPMIDWAPIDPLIGKKSDTVIAAMFKISAKEAGRRRRKLEIKAQLGKVPDPVLAEKYHLSRERIRQLRDGFGIESNRDVVLRDHVAELLKATDRASFLQIIRKLGMRVSCARVFCLNHGIPYHGARVNWRPVDRFLGTDYDFLIAKRFHLITGTVTQRRKKLKIKCFRAKIRAKLTAKFKKVLGRFTDRTVAGMFGVSESAVHARKKVLGMSRQNGSGSVEWKKYDKFLGTASDMKLSKKLGIGVQTVYMRRRQLGIPAHGN